MYWIAGSLHLPPNSHQKNFLRQFICLLRHNLKSKVPFKYLMMHFMAIQCDGPAFNMNWLTVLTANTISTLVATIAYIRDPTPALYRTPSISLCTFTNFSSKSFNYFEFTLNEVLTGLHFSMFKSLEDLFDVAPLVHGDDMSFSIPLKFYC